MSTPRHQREERLAELLSEYIDREAEGAAPPIEEFVARHPDLADALRPLLQTSNRVGRVAPALEPIRSPANAFNTIRGKFLAGAERERLRAAVEQGEALISVDQRQDLVLLLVRAASRVLGKTKLMKLLFLLGKETRAAEAVPGFFEHVAYNFGPFDDAVYQDIDGLRQHRLVIVREPAREVGRARQVEAIYSLTSQGQAYADALARWAERNDPDLLREIGELVRKYASLPTDKLLRYVYQKYPESAVNSTIRDEVLGDAGEDDES